MTISSDPDVVPAERIAAPWGKRKATVGSIFLCHWSKSETQVKLIDQVLQAHGLGTWFAPNDLSRGVSSTNSQLRSTIASPEVVGFLAWGVEGIENRSVVQDVEIQAALARQAEDDTFPIYFTVPQSEVTAGGYSGLNSLFPRTEVTGGAKVSERNVTVIEDPSHGELLFEDVVPAAKAILGDRISALDRELEDGEPIQVQIHTKHAKPDGRRDLLLNFGWLFPHGTGLASDLAWDATILPTMRTVVSELERTGRTVVFGGELRTPGAILLGALSRRARAPRSWVQVSGQGGSQEQWTIMGPATEDDDFEPLVVTSKNGTAENHRVLLTLNLATWSQNVEGPAAEAVEDPGFALGIHIDFRPGSSRVLSAKTAIPAIKRALTDVHAMCKTLPGPIEIHVMGAMPAGISFALGRWLTTFASVRTYEFDSSADQYRRAVSFSREGLPFGMA